MTANLEPIQTSAGAIAYVRERTDSVIVSYSAGKDSLAAWLNLLEATPDLKLTPVYHYLVPDLEFVERYLDYVEAKLGTRILRLPHPLLNWMLHHAAHQDAVRTNALFDIGVPKRDYGEYIEAVKTHYALPEEAWVAVGTTRNDSVNRRLTFRQYGMVRESQRKFFPIADFKKDDLIAIIKRHGVKLPPDYRIWGRSFDGIDYFFLEGVRRHFPRDYARIVEWFPLITTEHTRFEMMRRAYHG